MSDLEELRKREYQQRLLVERLRREAAWQDDLAAAEALFDELVAAELALAGTRQKIAEAEKRDARSGLVAKIGVVDKTGVLSLGSTGLSAQVHLRMAQIPTATYHLYDPEENPLLSCMVRTAPKKKGQEGARSQGTDIRRMRVVSYIDGYSAEAVNSVELRPDRDTTFNQLPTLFPDAISDLTELTRATLNVRVEDLDNGRIEKHSTHPIWLLARTTAPIAVRDPRGGWQDLSPYLGAFVTPNAPALMAFLRSAAEMHPQKQLIGYQGDETKVEPQVRALFDALKTDAKMVYVNSVIDFTPDEGTSGQRVRLPRESLLHHQANCLDGTVLFASLLEAISLSPAIVLVPGHAFVAWETWKESDDWRFLETTMIGTKSFEEACTAGEFRAARAKKMAEKNPSLFRLWPLRVLRVDKRITPME
jgi:hypothetical protein